MTAAATLFALWPFVNPAMLWWAAAAAAPIIIHLLSKRRYREVEWAAMRYLVAAMRRSSRRIRIEQILLLLIRTLMLLLLVLAVAQPYLDEVGVGLIQGQRTHKVLVVDGSYSMGYRSNDTTLFERAKEVAQDIVDNSAKGDGFTLILMSRPPRVVVATPAFEANAITEEIENLKLPHGGVDLPATLEKVEEVLRRSRDEAPKLTKEEVYILSDLGRSSWIDDSPGESELEQFRSRSRRLAEQAALVVIDLGQSGAENVAVTDIRVKQPLATVAQEVQVEAQVRNFGRQARPRQRIELYVDGRPAAEQQVDLDPAAVRTVTFTHQFGQGGDHHLEVRLAADALDIDNHRWLSLNVKEYVHVLCVNGKPTGDAFTGATGYLHVALAPSETGIGRTAVRPDVVNEGALQEIADLNQYDCIFLANVRQFIGAEARRLESYLKHGGGLIVFLGDQVQPESYNRFLAGRDPGGVRVLPAEIGALVATSDPAKPFHIDPLDYRHPIVGVFQGNPGAGLAATDVENYYELKLPADSKARVALGIQGGGPLVVEESIHRGRSILVATSADTSWTSMPLLPTYVPVIQELLTYAITGRLTDRNTRVGQSIGGSLRTTSNPLSATVRLPDDQQESLELMPDGDDLLYTYAQTYVSGTYTVDIKAATPRQELFAVNVEPREGDLTKLEQGELAQEVWPDVPFAYWTGRQDVEEQPVEEITRRGDLHQGLMLAVVVLLFVETFLAWLFGHHRTV